MKNEQKLVWRLKDKPTAADIADLVEQGIIDTQAAQGLIFGDPSENRDSKKIEALEEEVKFLRKLCDTLASKANNGWGTIVREYHDYHPHYPIWYEKYKPIIGTTPYVTWGASTGTTLTTGGTLTTTNANLVSTAGASQKLSALNN
jgi:hypothetical protein